MNPFEAINNSIKYSIKSIADEMSPRQLMQNPSLLEAMTILNITWRN